MNRLLSVNIIKSFFNISFVILMLGTIGISFFSLYFLKELSLIKNTLPPSLFETLKTGTSINMGITRLNSLGMLDDLKLMDFIVNILNSSSIETILAVSLVKIITDEYKYNSLFVYISKGFKRIDIFLSYIFVAVLHTLALSVVYIVSFVCCAFIFKINMHLNISQLFNILITQGFMLISFSIMIVAISIMIKKPIHAIMVMLSIIFVLPTAMLYIKTLYRIDINIEKFWLLTRLYEVGTNMPVIEDYLSAIVTAVISIICGYIAIKKARFNNI